MQTTDTQTLGQNCREVAAWIGEGVAFAVLAIVTVFVVAVI